MTVQYINNKHKKILKELERKRSQNNTHCVINDCEPSPFMQGANTVINEMIEFIEKLDKTE